MGHPEFFQSQWSELLSVNNNKIIKAAQTDPILDLKNAKSSQIYWKFLPHNVVHFQMTVEAPTERHNTKDHVRDISHRLVWLSYFCLFMIIFFKLRYICAALHP